MVHSISRPVTGRWRKRQGLLDEGFPMQNPDPLLGRGMTKHVATMILHICNSREPDELLRMPRLLNTIGHCALLSSPYVSFAITELELASPTVWLLRFNLSWPVPLTGFSGSQSGNTPRVNPSGLLQRALVLMTGRSMKGLRKRVRRATDLSSAAGVNVSRRFWPQTSFAKGAAIEAFVDP